MKIVLVHNTYQQPGGEDVVFENERRLLEQGGHRVIPYVRSNNELEATSILGQAATLARTVWSSNVRRDFGAILDAESPEIVHVHNTFMVISPSIYSACSERKVPVVQSLHNYRLLCPSSNFYRAGKVCEECVDHSLLRSVRYGCYRSSRPATAGVALMLATHRKLNTWRDSVTRFIAMTEFARNKFVTAGFPPDKFVVKPNFVDPDPGERPGTGEYALYIGRLAEDKGVRTLLNAWQQLPKQYRLHIIGDGPERAACEAQAKEQQLSGVTFRGRLPRAEVMAAAKNAKFIIVPSLWYEGFPMTITESFACGTPVLCSRLGSMQEIVTDQITGLYFTPGDAQDLANKVTWAWNHPTEVVAMGHAARRKYETVYSPERNYSLLMNIYAQAMEQTVPATVPVPILN
jgi:glycosyltransferase involved in cell wall biosynthesis